jgi:metal-dependent hydrolase (beta-lactamase superfamily II)
VLFHGRLGCCRRIWLIRGGGHNIPFDSGHHRDSSSSIFLQTNTFLRRSRKLSGGQPNEITDIVISHVHWNNFGGIDLFPKTNVWIQQDEFRYYTGAPWQPGGGSFVND